MTCAPGLLCAEENVGNLKKKCTFRISGTVVRRTRRRKSQKKMHFLEFWDSCAQNRTSDMSNIALSGTLELLCAEQDAENLKIALSGILGLLCAEHNVRNLKNGRSRILGLLYAEENVGESTVALS